MEETMAKEGHLQRKQILNIGDLSSISACDRLTEKGLKQKGSFDYDDKDTLIQREGRNRFEDLFKSSPVSFGDPFKIFPVEASPVQHVLTARELTLSSHRSGQENELSTNSEFCDLVKMVPIVKDSKCVLHVSEREPVKGSECVVFKINPSHQLAQSDRDKAMINTQVTLSKNKPNTPIASGADQCKVPTHTAKGSRRNSGLSSLSNPNSFKLEDILQVKTGSRGNMSSKQHLEDCKQIGDYYCDCERRREQNRKPNYLLLSSSNQGRRMTTNDMYRRNNTTNFDEWSEHHPDLWHKLKF